MFTEEQITKSTNDTPIGLASWCWGADIDFNGYCDFCNDIAISPVSQEAFEFIHNWWNTQWNAIEKAKIQ